jgi:AcrR family transcriptional regulator
VFDSLEQTGPGEGGRRRAKGERSRAAILTASAELATVEGLDGLSLSRLADHVGISKSGILAHFGSKEELQLATVDAAFEVWTREVVRPGLAHPEGVAQVYGLCDAFLSYVERRVFPGGCFFISAASELDAKEGPVRDRVRAIYGRLLEGFGGLIRRAQELGEIDPAADPDRLMFELDALMVGANLASVFFGDDAATDHARAAIRERLEGLRPA